MEAPCGLRALPNAFSCNWPLSRSPLPLLAFTIKRGSFIIAAAPYAPSFLPSFSEQVRLSGDLLGRDDHQVGGAGLHPQQLQLPQVRTYVLGNRPRIDLKLTSGTPGTGWTSP